MHKNKFPPMQVAAQKIFPGSFFTCFIYFTFFISCSGPAKKEQPVELPISAEKMHDAGNALRGLDIFKGLHITVMATEPMLRNPTNIDVDEQGRVWVTEAYNYRPAINGNPTNPDGDRIIILQDNTGDGIADTSKIFYQGPEINAPLGICVLGNRVLISQSPYVWSFYDDNGDDKADRKEILFQGIGGEQHDHGIHTFTFGPDGKLYFNFGNEGRTLKDKNNKPVLDQDGEEIGPKKYTQGMVFRCDPDGSHVECLGQNFRNPYEVAVDSYGTMWQSDNDDDGNRGVRINYVMEYGKYGFKDEITGASWQSDRTNMEDSIPFRHWHLNDPGVMPNVLQTGAGSPTGMVIYEGKLLPEKFRGLMIHCDAGPNVVRAYPVTKKGAGYSADTINILKGNRDKWFRPADICVAPDGSLIIADWYDPGVGGHAAGDQTRGRIYRVAPPDSAYHIPHQDYSTVTGAITALQNPNLSVRYHAWTALQNFGLKAVPELENLWKTGTDSRMRARAFWALVKLPGSTPSKYIYEALHDSNPDIRILALRASRELKLDVAGTVQQLLIDRDKQVLRECAIALRHISGPGNTAFWATLATAHTGADRWYLEALGIGADRQWDTFFKAYLSLTPNPTATPASRDIVWRARTDLALPYLASLASDKNIPIHDRLRYFRAFDFHPGAAKSAYLLKMLNENTAHNMDLNKLVLHALDQKTVEKSALAKKALQEVIITVRGTREYIDLVKRYRVTSEKPQLLDLAVEKSREETGRDAAGLLLDMGGQEMIKNVWQGKDTIKSAVLMHAVGGVGSKISIDMLQAFAFSEGNELSMRKIAASNIGRSWGGEERVLDILKNNKVPKILIPDVVTGVSQAWRGSVRTEAASYLESSSGIINRKVPGINELRAMNGNAANGKTIFLNTCALCHKVSSEGYDFGPALTEIGAKLSKDGLWESILHPSAGISFGYEGWNISMKDGTQYAGIISSKTETDIDLKLPGGIVKQIKTGDVTSMTQMPASMMPEALYKPMKDQDIADLLEYLSGLVKR
jgi:putative membrane-bound dehydrogenase-like protein